MVMRDDVTYEVRPVEKHLTGGESSCSDLQWTLEAPQQVTLQLFPLFLV